MSDAEVRDALAEENVDPARAERLRKVVAGTRVTQLDAARRRRGRWMQASLLLAAAAVVVLAIRGSRDDRVGAGRPPDDDAVEARNREAARALRDEAFGLCEKAQWHACDAKLDDAQLLDPDGEEDARVQTARRAVDAALGRPPRKPQPR